MNELASLFPPQYAWLVPVFVGVCNVISRKIPDSATGPLQYVRIVTSILGMHGKDNKA